MKRQNTFGLALLGLSILFVGCTPTPDAKEKVHDVKGKVVSVDAANKKVTLDHEEIPGVMKAMTMPFNVADAKMLDGLSKDDPVQGKLTKQDGKWMLTELKKRN